jgi:hypothetical protein
MDTMMVSQDAYDKLHQLEIITTQHGEQFKAYEKLLAQNTETLKEVKDVLVNTAVTNERLNNMDKRQDKDDVRHEKLEAKVNSIQSKIMYYSGGVAVLVFAIGIGMALMRQLT